jgi:hypothetical protein
MEIQNFVACRRNCDLNLELIVVGELRINFRL